MAIIQRPTKQGGATTFQGKIAQGYTKILASEADADIDTIFAAWNGGVDTVNIRDNAVTSAKIFAGAVGARELADGSIGLAEINQTSLAMWAPSGTGLTPATGGASPLVLPGAADKSTILLGTQTAKARVQAANTAAWLALAMNRDAVTGVVDDTSKAAWQVTARADTDQFAIGRHPVGGALGTVLSIGSDSKTVCTLADGSVQRQMIGIGHTVRGAPLQVPVPPNYSSNNVINTFFTICSASYACTGGWVLLQGWTALQYAGASGVEIIMAYYRDTTGLNGIRFRPSASTGGVLILPLPGMSFIDQPPAGTHTYALKGFVVGSTSANITAQADNTGAFQIMELS